MKNSFEIRGTETAVFLSSREGLIESVITTKSLEVLNNFQGTFRAVWNENTKSYYAMGYERVYGKKINIMMHRYIVSCTDDLVVDHVNHNTLDNRIENLRVVNQSQNMLNFDPAKRRTITGISWYEDKKKWRVRIQGKHIGYFSELHEAEKKALELHIV
ncbi:HNH endonuclease [Paenibacillus xylanexedens]|uniref:HNH nuclease domain-containing protein n=1 Tax=Paenibacillus xylanexedens TaxID=528191 RepID=A0ABS4RLM8_PAEXY|nr:HNH endonuclease [Paenibacillus xylanexedens]MBP2243802.1 hypothetical protein [Paenibacillus xylanexedens]